MTTSTVECLVIDGDAPPTLHSRDWNIAEHRKMGQVVWSPGKFRVEQLSHQRTGDLVTVAQVLQIMSSKNLVNANVLDFLLAHPCLIPDEWATDEIGHGRTIYFLGTVFLDSLDQENKVRGIYRTHRQWMRTMKSVGTYFTNKDWVLVAT